MKKLETKKEHVNEAEVDLNTVLETGQDDTVVEDESIYTEEKSDLSQEAENIFEKWYKSSAKKLRLLGFGTAGLSPAGTGQKLLFSDPQEEKQKKIDKVYDKIRGKFGDDSLKRGM